MQPLSNVLRFYFDILILSPIPNLGTPIGCVEKWDGDAGTRRRGDSETRGRVDAGTRGRGDLEARGSGTRRHIFEV